MDETDALDDATVLVRLIGLGNGEGDQVVHSGLTPGLGACGGGVDNHDVDHRTIISHRVVAQLLGEISGVRHLWCGLVREQGLVDLIDDMVTFAGVAYLVVLIQPILMLPTRTPP